MKADYIVRSADKNDVRLIKELLQACSLPTVQIEKHIQDFIVAEAQGSIIGTLGAVYDGNKALLRSFAVCEKKRKNGIGSRLINMMLKEMRKKGIKEVFLLTETAADYFIQLEFLEISRDIIPKILLIESGLDQACPCSSRCFKYNIID